MFQPDSLPAAFKWKHTGAGTACSVGIRFGSAAPKHAMLSLLPPAETLWAI